MREGVGGGGEGGPREAGSGGGLGDWGWVPRRLQHSTTASMSVTIEDFVRMDQTTDYRRSKSLVAKNFLNSFWCKRVVLLMWAMHPWITMQFVSLFRSHVVPRQIVGMCFCVFCFSSSFLNSLLSSLYWRGSLCEGFGGGGGGATEVRASLIILKLVSAAAANALFFTSSAASLSEVIGIPMIQGLKSLGFVGARVGGGLASSVGALRRILGAPPERLELSLRRSLGHCK